MGYEKVSLRRTPRGAVSIRPYKDGLRLRWQYRGKRLELYVPPSVQNSAKTASIIATTIERDLLADTCDLSLGRYRALLELRIAALQEEVSQLNQSPRVPEGTILGEAHGKTTREPVNVLKEFERYLAAKSLSLDPDKLSSYYTQTIAMLKKWKDFDIEDTPVLLGQETFGPKTFNDRRNCLKKFFEWLVKRGRITSNPLSEVGTRRRERNCDQRKPYEPTEVKAILTALKTDRFKPASSRYSHSQYYPFLAFLFETGVRNAEAVGLKVRDVTLPQNGDLSTGQIQICRTLARTRKGTNVGARKEKGTKMNNVRTLPLSQSLLTLLQPLCEGRDADEFVFVNQNGNPIDDRQFLKRVLRPVQEKLGIQKRDLYACRHTFATWAVDRFKMKPNEVAYLMGDNVETVLQNYFHNDRKPQAMPSIMDDLVFGTPLKAHTQAA